MSKYKFSEIRGREVPEDCNKFLREFAMKIKCGPMLFRVDEIEKRRLFGTLVVMDSSGFVVAECGFREGVCPSANLEVPDTGTALSAPYSVRFRMSVRNPNVTMDKTDKGAQK
jgi:hypothetical protein